MTFDPACKAVGSEQTMASDVSHGLQLLRVVLRITSAAAAAVALWVEGWWGGLAKMKVSFDGGIFL